MHKELSFSEARAHRVLSLPTAYAARASFKATRGATLRGGMTTPGARLV